MKGLLTSLRLKSQKHSLGVTSLQSGIHTSLALSVLSNQLNPNRKHHILDLGPACGSNVDFFSQVACKIYIEDFYRTLTSFDFLPPGEGSSYEAVFEYLFPYSDNTRFDCIMGWDIFNYLEKQELRYLILHLARFCRPGTLLFALVSTQKRIPDNPSTYKILDQSSLLYEMNSSILRSCPRYGYSDLKQVLPGFNISSSLILRNGFKEYVFVYDGVVAN